MLLTGLQANPILHHPQNSNSAETLVSLIIVTQMLGKHEDSHRFMNQLRAIDPNHPHLTTVDSLESAFDSAAQQFA